MTDRRTTGNDGKPSISIVETSPAQIVMHRIEEYQLDKLTNISRPITLMIAGAAIGAFFSLLPAAITGAHHAATASMSSDDLLYCLVDAVALVIAATATSFSIKGEVEARRILGSIKSREKRPLL